MADVTLYKLLGLSRSPAEWMMLLIDEFNVDQERAEIFAGGWLLPILSESSES